MDDSLQETAVKAAIHTRWLGGAYHYLPSVGSTNDRLRQMVTTADAAKSPLPAGTLLVTDFQSHGRGRLKSRRWLAPAGSSLLMSILLRPNWPSPQSNWLSMMAGLAVVTAIEQQTELKAGLKWPNDIMVQADGTWRKTGGLLLEGQVGSTNQLELAILGIGLNVNIAAADLPEAATPATSLAIAAGHHLARLPILAEILRQLEWHYEAADHGQSPQAAWNARLLTLGQRVQVSRPNQERLLSGVAEGTDAWGQLIVLDDTGQRQVVAAGDVSLRPDKAR